MDYKDAYHALRSQHSDLQRKYHDRAEELKRTNVQLSKIEQLMRTKERLDAGGGPPTTLAMREENEAIIKGLYQDKARLERRNGELDRRCRLLTETVEKKKREVAVLKRAARRPTSTTSRPSTAPLPEHVELGASKVSFAGADRNADTGPRRQKVDALVERFKRRVEEAEAQLARVKEDNRELRQKCQRQGRPLVVNSVKEVRSPVGKENRFADGLERDTHDSELREAKAEAQLLQMRYKQLEENTKAQRDVQKAQFDQLDEYNRRIRDLRRALQDSEADKDKLRLDADRVDELQERVTELQTANRRLEDELLKLSDVAMNQDFSQPGRETMNRDRLAELERNDNRHRAEFDNLRASAEGSQQAFVELQQQVDQLRHEKERAERELQQCKLRSSTDQVGGDVLEDKANFFGGLDGVDMDELERALTIVKKREHMANPDDFDFLEKIDPEMGNDLRQADYRKKLEELREQHLQTQYELERAEKMLKVQMSINRDLHLELEDASSKRNEKTRDLLTKVEDYEALNVKRLQRIHTLEAQLKQARYSTTSRKLHAIDEDDASINTESTNLLLAELNEGDLAADENLVEVWVVSASLDEGVVSPGASTFAVVDFLTYESQATQWLPGSRPEFDFATSFKVSVDDLFLRYLATESLQLEICEAQQADYELLAKASISLAPLLDSKPTLVLDKCPLLAARTGRQAGSVHVEIRLALPVTELYQLFLDRHPAERANIERAMLETLRLPGLTGESDDSARLENEIEVVVHSALNLPQRIEGRSKPSPYVHYQFLQFQDAFTPVSRSSTEPTFEHVLSYPLATTTQACSMLRTERLTFTVLDFQEENASIGDADDALIGTCDVPLSLLSDGEAVFSTTTLQSDTGREVGTLRVCVRWKHAFKQARTPDGSVLDEAEVAWCLERFSPRKDGQVDYLSFLHAVDAPARVSKARHDLVTFVEKVRLETGKAARDVLEAIDVESLSEDDFADAVRALGCSGSADELCAFLRHARKAHSGRFGLKELLAECRRAPPAEASVRSKVQHQAERLRRTGRELAGPFEDLDPARSGRLPRPHFRQGLRGLGFDLVDEPAQQVGDLFEARKKHDVAQLLGAELVSPRSDASDDDLIDRHTKQKLAAMEDDMDQQKEFEERMGRLQAQNDAFRSAPAPAPVQNEPRRSREYAVDPVELKAEAPAPHSPPAHRASVERLTPPKASYDDLNVSVAAALPQEASKVATSSLIEAEGALVAALAQKPADLGKHFRKVAEGGHVSRQQFAFVLGQRVQLTAAQLGAFMDHFATPDGIDHGAFLRFVEHEPIQRSVAAKALDRIAVHDGTLARLQAADGALAGSLPADTFGTVLRALGHDLDGSELRSLTQLFPPRRAPKGADSLHIDYEAFHDCCMDCRASVALRGVDGRLKAAIDALLRKGGPELLREEFRRCDRSGRSALERTDAEALLDTLLGSPACSRDEAKAILARLDNVGDGLTYDALVRFAQERPVDTPYAAETQDWSHVRARCRACLTECFDRLGAQRGDKVVKSAFKRYDWKGADVLAPDLFAQACRHAGVLVGASHLRALAERFDSGNRGAAWPRFLTWALENATAPKSARAEKHAERAKAALERIAPALRNARRWGVRSFERYDRDETGFIDKRDFERLLEDFRCDVEAKELKALCVAYGSEDGVEYKTFIKAVDGPEDVHALVASADASMVLRDALKAKVREGVDYRAAFEREDGAYSGVLDRKALERVLRQLEIPLEANALDELERKFRAATSGGIHYVELLNAVLPPRPQAGDNWRIEEKLRSMIKRRFEWWQPGALRRAFKHFDVKRKHKLLPADLADGLRALKIKLSAQQEQDLFEAVDLDKDGTVSYTEFVVFVRDPCHAFLEQKVRYATHRAKLRPADAEEALRDVDDNRSGLVGLRDFGVVLERLGVELSTSERKRLAQRFDQDESGNVDASKFLAFLKGDVETGGEGNPVLASLKRELLKSKKDIGRAFREFDEDDRGALGLRDFRRFLESLGCDLDASEAKACADLIGEDGAVSLKAFRKFAGDDEGSADHAKVVRKAAAKLKLDRKDVTKALKRYDEDGGGEVSRRDFKRVLDRLGLDLEANVVEAFGEPVEYLKFVKLCGEDDDDVDGVLRKLRRSEHELRKTLDGDVSERKLKNAADDAGVRLSTADLKALTQSFEGRRDDISGDKLLKALKADDDDDAVLRKLSKEVTRLNRRNPDYERVLRDFERDDGELDARSFRKALDRLGFELEQNDVAALVEQLGRRGVVKTSKFLSTIEDDREGEEDDLQALVRKAAKSTSAKKLRKAFETVDEDEAGRVSKRAFKRILEDLGLDLTQRNVEKLLEKFEKRGEVAYEAFCKFAHAEEGSDVDEDVFGALRSALKDAKEEGDDPLKAFEKLDRDACGEVDGDDFKKALKKLGYTPTAFEVKKCSEKFPGNARSSIDYEAFVKELAGRKKKARRSADSSDDDDDSRKKRSGRSPSKKRRNADSSDADDASDRSRRKHRSPSKSSALKALRKELARLEERKGRRLKLDRAFEAYDVDGKGVVSERDFRKALQKLGVELEDKEAYKACAAKFDKRGDGRVRWRDFAAWAQEDSDEPERNPSRTRARRSKSRSVERRSSRSSRGTPRY